MNHPAIVRRRVCRPSLWLVTFGDLLTLMLCFFLATISLRPLYVSPHSSVTERKAETFRTKPDAAVGAETAGTRLAATQLEPSVPQPEEIEVSVALTEASFAGSPAYFSRTVRAQLRKAVFTDGYDLRTVTVHACAGNRRYAAGQTASLSVERALRVRGQVIDMGVAPQAVRIRALGRDCAALPGRPPKQAQTLVVSSFVAREHHG